MICFVQMLFWNQLQDRNELETPSKNCLGNYRQNGNVWIQDYDIEFG